MQAYLKRLSEQLGIGIEILAYAICALLMGLSFWGLSLVPRDETADLIAKAIYGMPVLVGLFFAFLVGAEVKQMAAMFVHAAILTAAGIAMAFFFIQEGIICLIIISPLIFSGFALGTVGGWLLFRPGRDKVQFSLGLALVGSMFLWGLDPTDLDHVVTDEIVIQAPPAKVWPHVVAFRQIEAEPDFWLCHLGLPYPVSTTVTAYAPQATRYCNFSTGVSFVETMTEYQPDRKLTFDIVSQPRDPELLGHFTNTRGQFLLRDNGDGTTTLVGSSWYTLHTAPAGYFNLWAEPIICNVHLRVMRHIAGLSVSEATADR
jgi:hypothetical protein